MNETIPFVEKDVKEYLDRAITRWRTFPGYELASKEMASHYVDAFQSVRMSLFGELLPLPEGE
jgi:hypothetical protein